MNSDTRESLEMLSGGAGAEDSSVIVYLGNVNLSGIIEQSFVLFTVGCGECLSEANWTLISLINKSPHF